MSSFSLLSPNKSYNRQRRQSRIESTFVPCCSSLPTHSSLSPHAVSYIPSSPVTQPPESPQIQPVITRPFQRIKPHSVCPSFMEYERIQCRSLYNAISAQIHSVDSCRLQNECRSDSSSISYSSSSSSTLCTPIPESIASSLSSTENIPFDLVDIEPYIPSNAQYKTDIDLCGDTDFPISSPNPCRPVVISEEMEYAHDALSESASLSFSNDTVTPMESVNPSMWTPDGTRFEDENTVEMSEFAEPLHPAIAALTEQETFQLLDSAFWSQYEIEAIKDPNTHFAPYPPCNISKIAIDEEDYQYILHPNKSPVRYGSVCCDQVESNGNRKRVGHCTVAPDDGIGVMEPIHCEPSDIETVGESYDECWTSLANALRDQCGITNTRSTECCRYAIPGISDTKSVESTTTTISSSDSMHSNHSKVAAADPILSSGLSTEGLRYQDVRPSPRDLYEMRPSRVAVEGYNESQTTSMTTKMTVHPTNPKVAGHGGVDCNRRSVVESNVAAPEWTPVSYIYCRA